MRLSLKNAIVTVLKERASMTINEVLEEIRARNMPCLLNAKTPDRTISSELSLLAKDGVVKSIARGTYMMNPIRDTSTAVNEPAKKNCGRPKGPRKPTDCIEKTKTSTKRPATLNPTPRTKARKLHKSIEATLDDPATGFDISVLRSTYKNHFGTSPTSTHPTELRDVLIDAGIDNQLQAGIDPLSIISDAHPEFANLLSVIDRDLVNDSLKKKKKPKTCHGCNTNTNLFSNPDGKFWCRSCFWERERLKQNNGRGRQ